MSAFGREESTASTEEDSSVDGQSIVSEPFDSAGAHAAFLQALSKCEMDKIEPMLGADVSVRE